MAEVIFYNQFQLSSQLLGDAVRFRSSLIITGQVLLCLALPKDMKGFPKPFFLLKQSIAKSIKMPTEDASSPVSYVKYQETFSFCSYVLPM